MMMLLIAPVAVPGNLIWQRVASILPQTPRSHGSNNSNPHWFPNVCVCVCVRGVCVHERGREQREREREREGERERMCLWLK